MYNNFFSRNSHFVAPTIILTIIIALFISINNSPKKPCKDFLPDATRRPGSQCFNKENVDLVILPNGSGICACKK